MTANEDSFFLKFLIPYIKYYNDLGCIVDVASLGNEKIPYVNKKYKVDFTRKIFSFNNIKSIKQLKKIISKNKYDLIICHTPMGGMVTRMTNLKKQNKVIYVVHGFHFYKGAPLLNWLLFYPIEKFLSRFTNKIVTITKDDYEYVKNRFHCEIAYTHGIGVDISKFNKVISLKERKELKKELGIENKKVLLFAGELNKNKNQKFLIECMNNMDKDYILLLAGKGSYYDKYKELIKKYNLENNVKLLGFRNDIDKLLNITDIVVSSSYREGLPVNILEGLAHNIPIVASKTRGHKELIKDKKNGYLYEIDNKDDFINKVNYFKDKKIDPKINDELLKNYDINKVLKEMADIYD